VLMRSLRVVQGKRNKVPANQSCTSGWLKTLSGNKELPS
jgi:hypothetical protein